MDALVNDNFKKLLTLYLLLTVFLLLPVPSIQQKTLQSNAWNSYGRIGTWAETVIKDIDEQATIKRTQTDIYITDITTTTNQPTNQHALHTQIILKLIAQRATRKNGDV